MLERRLDTFVAVTNSDATTCLNFTLTIRDASGMMLATSPQTQDPHETRVIFLADLVP